MARGLSLTEAAHKMGTTRGAVNSFSVRAYAKLGVHSALAAVAEARARGIIDS